MTVQWIKAIGRDEVPEEDVIAVEAGGKEIALYGVNGDVYATDNLCTHGNARLCDGFLTGHEIECPLHQGRFDVRDGRALCSPLRENIATYPVRIEDGVVFVAL